MSNPTIETILSRLPATPLVTPRDISDALSMASTKTVIEAIDSGALAAARPGRTYIISRADAERWIRAAAVGAQPERTLQ